MRRREFFKSLAALSVTFNAGASAQQSVKVARIGRLSPLSEASEKPMIEGLRSGLADLGWVEGKNLSFELRFADGRLDRLPALAADLVRGQVDVIVTGSNPAALAAKQATGKIPIVFVTTGDPIAAGIVASLGRPGGNLTGITALGLELNAKRLELLKEAFGGINRIAVLTHPGSPYTADFRAQKETISRALGIEILLIEFSDLENLSTAVDGIRSTKAQGVLVLADILFVSNRRRVVELVAKSRLPATYPDRSFIDVGGLMFYGAALPDMYRHAAIHVDRILRGARPADLPVEQPTNFRLVVNAKTAKAMGLAIPPMLLARADEVIE